MSLAFIGPVAISIHGDPSFRWSGSVGPNDLRAVSISGLLEWDEARALNELVANPDRRVSCAGEIGVLETVWSSDALQRDFNGLYLLQRCEIAADQPSSLAQHLVSVTVDGLHLGSHEAVVIRTARPKANDFSLTAKSLVVQPFWGEDAAGEYFSIHPGGTPFTREYDPRTTYDPASLSTDGRELRLYEGVVT